MGLDIFDDDKLAAKSRRPAGAGPVPDLQPSTESLKNPGRCGAAP